jgi:hypothetical protein
MIPIYEQGSGMGIGHSFESFRARFEEICKVHGKSFALVLYDFQDRSLRKILKDQGVFAKLDRLTGDRLSLFYLHSDGREPSASTVRQFNEAFTSKLGLAQVDIPCVVFFRWDGKAFTDINAVTLSNTDLIHGFYELYDVVETYVRKEGVGTGKLKYLRWTRGTAKFVSVEVLRAALRSGFGHIF